jgi:hypothetical protein
MSYQWLNHGKTVPFIGFAFSSWTILNSNWFTSSGVLWLQESANNFPSIEVSWRDFDLGIQNSYVVSFACVISFPNISLVPKKNLTATLRQTLVPQSSSGFRQGNNWNIFFNNEHDETYHWWGQSHCQHPPGVPWSGTPGSPYGQCARAGPTKMAKDGAKKHRRQT